MIYSTELKFQLRWLFYFQSYGTFLSGLFSIPLRSPKKMKEALQPSTDDDYK